MNIQECSAIAAQRYPRGSILSRPIDRKAIALGTGVECSRHGRRAVGGEQRQFLLGTVPRMIRTRIQVMPYKHAEIRSEVRLLAGWQVAMVELTIGVDAGRSGTRVARGALRPPLSL